MDLVREDGWHTTATAVRMRLFLGNPPTAIYISIFLLRIRGVVHSSALVLCTPVQMSQTYSEEPEDEVLFLSESQSVRVTRHRITKQPETKSTGEDVNVFLGK
jgi:hypothetical protein